MFLIPFDGNRERSGEINLVNTDRCMQSIWNEALDGDAIINMDTGDIGMSFANFHTIGTYDRAIVLLAIVFAQCRSTILFVLLLGHRIQR